MAINPLPDMPILGSSNSAANKDMSKIWTNGDTVGEQFLLFPQCFQKLPVADASK